MWGPLPARTIDVRVALSGANVSYQLRAIDPDPDDVCERRTIGPCVVDRCPGGAPTGTDVPTSDVVVDVNGAEAARLTAATRQLLVPGTIAPGAVIELKGPPLTPAAPTDLGLISPRPPTLVVVSGAAPPMVEWSGATTGSVKATFASAVGGYRQADCYFPGIDGRGQIPAEVFAVFPPNGGTPLSINFHHLGRAEGTRDGRHRRPRPRPRRPRAPPPLESGQRPFEGVGDTGAVGRLRMRRRRSFAQVPDRDDDHRRRERDRRQRPR
jgi:hypothetical protein